MPRPLKVFCTPIGFHDAYVATSSRAAALRAWGSDVDLFARGIAEEVTDAALTREPLAQPGQVIRVSRGTTAEHLAALPADAPTPPADRKRRVVHTRTPPPSKAALTAAQDAATSAQDAFDERDRFLSMREAELAAERRHLDRERTAEMDRLQHAIHVAEEEYRQALAAWDG